MPGMTAESARMIHVLDGIRQSVERGMPQLKFTHQVSHVWGDRPIHVSSWSKQYNGITDKC